MAGGIESLFSDGSTSPESPYLWFRSVAYDLRIWASGDTTATEADFGSLRLLMLKAIVIAIAVSFAGSWLTERYLPEDLASFDPLVIYLGPIAGVSRLIKNFGTLRGE